MKIKPKVKKKKSKKLKAPALLKGSITKSACRDEVIWELYSECLKTEKDKNATRDIKIYLQNVDFPVSVNYKTDLLDDLKGKSIIKDYELKIEEEELPPIIFEELLEPNVDLLPLTSFKELKNAPKKYKAVNHAENGYVAIVKCDPQKVIKYLKNDFKRVNQKRKEITKREEIKDSFEGKTVLECDKLRFSLESGNAIYGDTITNFKPGTKEYNLLKEFLEHPNRRRSVENLTVVLFPYQKGISQWKDYQKKVKWFVNNIRKKLEMYGKNPKNEDLFEPCNGYRIKCREK